MHKPYQLVLVCTALLAILIHLSLEDRRALNSVKSGEYALTCLLDRGDTLIAPELLIDHVDGTWIFTNSYSSNCTLTRRIL